MKTYKLKQEGFEQIRKRIVMIAISFGFIGIIYASYIGTSNNVSSSQFVTMYTIVILAMVLVLRRMLKTQKESWTSYEITISENSISKNQSRQPYTELGYDEIGRVEEVPGRGLYIKDTDDLRFIYIPDILDGYEEVKAHVSELGKEMKTVSVPSGTKSVALNWNKNLALNLGRYTPAFAVVLAVINTDINVILIMGAVQIFAILLLFYLHKKDEAFRAAIRLLWINGMSLVAIAGKVVYLFVK